MYQNWSISSPYHTGGIANYALDPKNDPLAIKGLTCGSFPAHSEISSEACVPHSNVAYFVLIDPLFFLCSPFPLTPPDTLCILFLTHTRIVLGMCTLLHDYLPSSTGPFSTITLFFIYSNLLRINPHRGSQALVFILVISVHPHLIYLVQYYQQHLHLICYYS